MAATATSPYGAPPNFSPAPGTATPAAYGTPINPGASAAAYPPTGPALQAPAPQYPAVTPPGNPTAGYPAAGTNAPPPGANAAPPNAYPLPAPYGAPQGNSAPQGYAPPGASLSPGYTPGQQPLSMPACPPSETISSAAPPRPSLNPFASGFRWWKKRQDNFDYEPIRAKRAGMREEVPYSD
ncbi:MAG: hypothetical protein JSS27_04665 [Planctomycetes bacterium]|nr:hypothetical protein [Planctomycetota bacterium]